MNRFLAFGLFLMAIVSCSDDPIIEEEVPNPTCSGSFTIDGVTESFCNWPSIDFKTNLSPTNELYIQYKDGIDLKNLSSENFEMFNIAFTVSKPDSNNWESETAFYEEIIDVYKPESLHPFNVSSLGGFGIELWDKEGNYFSTEFGNGNSDVYMEVRNLSFEYLGPNYGQVISHMRFTLVSTAPVTLYNSDLSRSHKLEIKHHWLWFTFNIDD